MRVWLVKIGEPLPTDTGDPRPGRTWLLAEALKRRGHEVTWWTSSFDHRLNNHRAVGLKQAVVDAGKIDLQVLKSPGYRASMSVGRQFDHLIVGIKFFLLARKQERPDLIVSSLPTLELCAVTRRFGKAWGIPYIVDIRDLWPDIYIRAFPKKFRPLLTPLIWPLKMIARLTCRDASAIMGVSQPFVDWGLAKAGRASTPLDVEVPLGYPAPATYKDQSRTEEFWSSQGVGRGDQCISFLGAFNKNVDYAAVVEVASRLAEEFPSVKFVMAGDGDGANRLLKLSRSRPNIIVPGWIGKSAIQDLLERSILGLLMYVPSSDFLMSIPNKVPEYLSAGVPIATTLQDSEVSRLIDQHGCGFTYSRFDADALEQIVRRVIGAPDDERNGWQVRAKQLYEARFRAEVVYDQCVSNLEASVKKFRTLK